MGNKSKGELFYNAFDRFMPRYFRYINPIIHKAGQLSENQVRIIMALNFLGSATPTQLSKCFGIQKGSLTTILRSLLNMGLINKQRSENDERKYYVSITEKAKALIQQKELEDTRTFEKLFEQMPADDAAAITQGMQMLCAYFDKMEEPL